MPDRERATFTAEELVVVLSHYDLGIVESVTEFLRGSHQSPKMGLVTAKGKFLLKRRASRRSKLERVRFAHRVQGHLEKVGFPVPRLQHTRDRDDTLVGIRGRVYELFEFIAGQPYRQSSGEAGQAGAQLARFHTAMEGFTVPALLPVPGGDYHDHPALRQGIDLMEEKLVAHDSLAGDFAALAALLTFLRGAYDSAAAAVQKAGFTSLPERIIHGDWHPGNLLFRHDRVAAVIDFDSARRSRRVIDIANGALQFSMVGGGDPSTWPDHLDHERYQAFLCGYGSEQGIGEVEMAGIPNLMIEALIAECVPAIQETGSVGRWPGYRVLQMARRKITWINANREGLLLVPTQT